MKSSLPAWELSQIISAVIDGSQVVADETPIRILAQ